MENRIESGLEFLRREARDCRRQDRNWPWHNELMRRAQRHVELCGGDWLRYESDLKREFADLMHL